MLMYSLFNTQFTWTYKSDYILFSGFFFFLGAQFKFPFNRISVLQLTQRVVVLAVVNLFLHFFGWDLVCKKKGDSI